MKSWLQKICLISTAISFVLGWAAVNSVAQPYSNDWINTANPHYKFKVAQKGIYRISKSQLDAIGMGSITGIRFTLFREGAKVPIFTSTNGSFGSNDFIEFYASGANGNLDKAVYLDPDFLPNEDIGIISDTAYYFLTYSDVAHPRMFLINNAIPSPAPAPAAFCWATAVPANNIRNYVAPGKSYSNQEVYYSADFDNGEGYAYNDFNIIPNGNFTLNIATPQAFTTGPNATVNFTWASHSTLTDIPYTFNLFLNNNQIFNHTLPATSNFEVLKRSLNVGSSTLSGGNAELRFNANRNYYILNAKVRYPRAYNFSGNFSQTAAFRVPAADRYLEISGFATNGQSPRLYDVTNSKIYIGTESGGVVRFYLDASVFEREMFLSNVSSISNAQGLSAVTFRNYANTANQGDYIILTHKDYINATPNYVNDFRNYRASATGGSYKPVVVDVTELYEQFGYGFEYHPLGIRNFLDYAVKTWDIKPEYLFIIGKGFEYSKYRAYQQNAAAYTFSPVPTWGLPGSDNLFSSFNNSQIPLLATGRLSAYNNQEIGNYLEKVKVYEQALNPDPNPTVASEMWKKKALHVAGGSDLSLQQHLTDALNSCRDIFVDTLIGGSVSFVRKSSTDPVGQAEALVDSVMKQGLGYVTFYGHGSAQGFDYNLNAPNSYNSKPRFPVFSAFACAVADMFHLSNDKTIGESYISANNGGSIVMMAANNTGWTGQLTHYMYSLYKGFSYRDYGKTLGMQYRNNIEQLQNDFPNIEMMDIHTQSIIYQGDPAIKRYNPELPDFAIEQNGLTTIPATVNTSIDTFELKVGMANLAKAVKDTITVTLQHFRNGSVTPVFTDTLRIEGLLNTDTVIFRVPLNPTTDVGVNTYTVKVDSDDQFDEVSENNNQASLQVFIYSENLVPVYPKEFAIVHQQGTTLKASTLNAFAPMRKYKLEIDTTELFNSTVKQSTEISSVGGVIKWTPSITYQDSVVYYWRATPDSLVNGNYAWSYSSFIYLQHGSDGWNQSHFYQLKKDQPYVNLELEEATGRKFQFAPINNVFQINNRVIYNEEYLQTQIVLNDLPLLSHGCVRTGSLYIVVIDSTNGKPWRDAPGGTMGSVPACHPNPREVFEFSYGNPVSRNNARLFLESLPNGVYVGIQNQIENNIWNNQTIQQWRQDSVLYGGSSLYHTIRDMGFTAIEQFTYKYPFGFFMKKGYPSTVEQVIATDTLEKITLTVNFDSYEDTGKVVSTIIGPALEWQQLIWRRTSTGNTAQNDTAFVVIYGIDTANNESPLYLTHTTDTSLAFIDAAKYPRLKLNWYSIDTINRTSTHLDFWRVLYKPVPEAALNAAAFYQKKDTLTEGETGSISVAIENLTPYPMDSMLVDYKIIDGANVKHNLGRKRFKPLAGNDTLIAHLDFDISTYYGQNHILIEANPDKDQPEQYHPNNLGYIAQYIDADKKHPLLDVTFDGIHILDRDIVSAKPFIKVLLRDENPHLPLNDTALMTISLLHPNQSTPVEVPMDGTICKFLPAQLVNGKKNEATIEYNPELLVDGVYKLIVTGKDRAGNTAGNTNPKYEINFTVENKPSITRLLNYPNPFSTATQFVFTLTGSEIPSQFKIQILTVTGKVVREIKKYELGNLHIGRNITEYKWDGTDEYGQLLGNGVYLYRVVTSIRGEEVEHRQNAAIDKYFKNGYGKLYIMR